MLMLEMVKWWYGRGWAATAASVRKRLGALYDMFSITILLRTLFSPWKRILTYPGAGLEAHLRAFLDNLVSRFIGFFVRLVVLVSAAVAFVLLGTVSLLELIAWPLLPLLAVALVIRGLI